MPAVGLRACSQRMVQPSCCSKPSCSPSPRPTPTAPTPHSPPSTASGDRSPADASMSTPTNYAALVDDDPAAFPTLDEAQLAALDALGSRRSVVAGEYLFREGDAAYDFYVVVSGSVDIVIHSDGEERFITRHGAGRFLGELNMLTGLRVFVSARVVEPGEVIVVPVADLRRMLATQPALGDTILAAFMARRAVLLIDASAAIRVVGSR